MNYLVANERLFRDAPSGSARIAWGLARLMAERGHHVAYLCGSVDSDPSPGVETVEGIRVVRYRFPRLHGADPRRLDRHVEVAASAVRAHLSDVRWDVVHSHTLAPGLGAFAGAGGGARRVATIHSPAVLEQRLIWGRGGAIGRLKLMVGLPMLRSAEKRLYAQAHRLTALSRFTVGGIAETLGGGIAERIEVIPWWSETVAGSELTRSSARAALGWPEDGVALFTLRRLVPRMGLDTLIDAVRQLAGRARPMTLYVAGEGPERAELERRAGDAIEAGRIRFLGRLSDPDLARAYRAADLFVLPTLALECFGIITLEALALGCPVLATRVGAIPEMLEPVMPGFLFDPGDVGGLAARIDQFVEGRLRAPDAAALGAYVARQYGRDVVSARYLEVLEGQPTASQGTHGHV